jgi:hypothetical protein
LFSRFHGHSISPSLCLSFPVLRHRQNSATMRLSGYQLKLIKKSFKVKRAA